MALTDQVIMPGADYQAAANQVRELSGTTTTLKSGEMVTALEGANDTVAAQATQINALIQQANNLPAAGGGGSGDEEWHDWITYTVPDGGVDALDISTGDDGSTLSSHNSNAVMIYSPSISSGDVDAAASATINDKYIFSNMPTFVRPSVGRLYAMFAVGPRGLHLSYFGRDTNVKSMAPVNVITTLENKTISLNGKFYAAEIMLDAGDEDIAPIDQYIRRLKIISSGTIKAGVKFVVKARW